MSNPVNDLKKYPLRVALKRVGWTLAQYLNARTDPAFARIADMAIAEREVALIDVIESATAEDWHSAAWLAEHTTPDLAPRTLRAEVQAELLRILDILETKCSGAAFREIVAALAGELGSGETAGVRDSQPKRLTP